MRESTTITKTVFQDHDHWLVKYFKVEYEYWTMRKMFASTSTHKRCETFKDALEFAANLRNGDSLYQHVDILVFHDDGTYDVVDDDSVAVANILRYA